MTHNVNYTLPKSFNNNQNLEKIKEYKITNNKEIKDEIINHNLKFILFVLNKKFSTEDHLKIMQKIGLTTDDLFQEGYLTIEKSIDKFDINQNINFTTYLYRALVNNFSSIFNKKYKFELSVSFSSLDDILMLNESNDDNVSKEEYLSFKKFIDNERINEEIYYNNQLVLKSFEFIENIKNIQHRIIMKTYVINILNNKPIKNLDKYISEKMGISRSYSNMIRNKYLLKLRKYLLKIKEEM